MEENTETTFWKGSPSQWLNIGHFAAALLLATGITIGGVFFPPALIALIIPLIWIVWRYLVVRTQVFEMTNERLRVTKGIINQEIDEVELYRVKDILVVRKWWMRMTGLGTIHLDTSDRSMPQIDIHAIHDSLELRESLRKKVEAMRDKKRVREMDFDETAAEDGGSEEMV
jgi:uncharacterized membrane protein YdbT with pleckstrin-like domain